MSNYYNNNQRGYNQYQPNQNMYQQPNYGIPPGNMPRGNIYNQNSNYNQGNYNQNQNQNIGPKIFISGNIGRINISSEDLETFSKSLKSTEWTTNQNYLQAENIRVSLKLSLQGQLQSEIAVPKNRFNEYALNSNFNLNEFQNFIKSVEDENIRKKDEAEKEKTEFLRVNFPNESPSISNSDLYKKIGENKREVIIKDRNLYGKVERLLPLLKNEDAPKSAGNYDIKRSGIFDYEKKEDKKLFTNDNTSTPSGDFNSPWNNDNKKKFSNDRNTGTPGFY